MTWHIFVLVWGEDYVRRYGEIAVPFQAADGNLPALARAGNVVYHAYTDAASEAPLRAALGPLAPWADIQIHRFDDASARGLPHPDYRYEVQRACLRELAARASRGDPIVLLDSNFVVADGTLAALARRRAEGFRVATVSFVRVATETFRAPATDRGARALLRAALPALHPMSGAFFVEAVPFTPYPSRLCWRAGDDGFVSRDFLPHPLMVPASDALGRFQSTMDYDLALRSAADEEIHVCPDSGEMLVVKFSTAMHGADRVAGPPPTPESLGRFLLVCTNRRHRLFADTPIQFRTGDGTLADDSQGLIDAAYAWIDAVASAPLGRDARLLMYLKSHFGPIEDFLSPQLEPAALARL